jgi:hypothetical protein
MQSVRVVMLNDRGAFAAVSRRADTFLLMTIQSGQVALEDELKGTISREGSVEVLNAGSKAQVSARVVELDASRVRAMDWVRRTNDPQRVQYADGYP